VGIERQIGNSFSVSANYIYVHTTHHPWAVDTNLLPGAPIQSEFEARMGFLPTDFLSRIGALSCVRPIQVNASRIRRAPFFRTMNTSP
jgi:hypothetical protein